MIGITVLFSEDFERCGIWTGWRKRRALPLPYAGNFEGMEKDGRGEFCVFLFMFKCINVPRTLV